MRSRRVACLLVVALAIPSCVRRTPAEKVPIRLVLNEIALTPTEDPNIEWIEIFNKGVSTSLEGIQMLDGDKLIASLPDWTIPSEAYLVLVLGDGVNDEDLSDSSGTYFVGSGDEILDDSRGRIRLIRGDRHIDEFSYDFPGGTGFSDLSFAYKGSSIARDLLSNDTNSPADWVGDGGLDAVAPTPGLQNLSADVNYLVDIGDRKPCKKPSGDLSSQRGLLEKVLKQIHREHLDNFQPPDLLDPGFGAWDGTSIAKSESNEVRVDDITVRLCDGLGNEGGRDVAGITPEPAGEDEPADPYVFLIDVGNFFGTGHDEQALKDIVIHELVHVATLRNPKKGMWRQVQTGRGATRNQPATAAGQDKLIPCHEVLAHHVNLSLLQDLLLTGEGLPESDKKWKEDRIEQKTKRLVSELEKCRAALKKLKGPAEIAVRNELASELISTTYHIEEKLLPDPSGTGDPRENWVEEFIRKLIDELAGYGANPPERPAPSGQSTPQPSPSVPQQSPPPQQSPSPQN